jgi:hypothetical protein
MDFSGVEISIYIYIPWAKCIKDSLPVDDSRDGRVQSSFFALTGDETDTFGYPHISGYLSG